jgi:hypothetical protein
MNLAQILSFKELIQDATKTKTKVTFLFQKALSDRAAEALTAVHGTPYLTGNAAQILCINKFLKYTRVCLFLLDFKLI